MARSVDRSACCWLAAVAGGWLACLLLAGCVEGEKVVDGAVLLAASQSDRQEQDGAGLAVSELLAGLDRYVGAEVRVFGQVRAGLAFEFVGEQPYQLAVGDARLWVVTSGPVPADGSWTTVRGVVRAPYQLKGRHYDAVLVALPEGE